MTLVPNTGPFPHWRIKRLPNMRHAIPDAPRVTDSVTKNGITTTALAWRNRHQVFLQVRPILPAGSHQWELATTERWSEWETFDRLHNQGARVPVPVVGRGGVFSREDVSYRGALTNEFFTPYRSASRYARVDCELRQFETCDEAVTFHNLAVKWDEEEYRSSQRKYCYLALPHALTATTPSGIVITLPPQGQDKHESLSAPLSFSLSVKPRVGGEVDLPSSPLARMSGESIKTRLAFTPDFDILSESFVKGSEESQFSVYPPRNPAWHPTPKGVPPIPFNLDLPPVLKDFTVIIHQRVDLQTIPMTFTVPVSDTPPPDVH